MNSQWVDAAYFSSSSPYGLYGHSPQSQPNSRLSADAVAYLRSHYNQDPKPTTIFKRQIANELCVDISKINNWFQNERAKTKSLARVENQRRLNGELPEQSDEVTPSSSSSATPAIEQTANAGRSPSRPEPLPIHMPATLPTSLMGPSSATDLHHFEALDLQHGPQNTHLAMSLQHGPVPMSAPAHMTAFPQDVLSQTWMAMYAQPAGSHSAHSPTQPMHSTTSDFITAAGPMIFTDIPQSDPTWPFSAPLNGPLHTPLSAGFDFGLFEPTTTFDTPLHSAQLDGSFDFSSPLQSEHTHLAEPSYAGLPLPHLSPTEDHRDPSIVSDSMPHTPATYAPDSFPLVDPQNFHGAFAFSHNTAVQGNPCTSPNAPFKTVSPADLIQAPITRPPSTQSQSRSFTRKRNIDIPQLSLDQGNATELSLQKQMPKLRPTKSMVSMRSGQRSPLHPMRDDTRRISKCASHARLPTMPSSIPPVPSIPRLC